MLELSASIDNCNKYIRNLEKELDYRSNVSVSSLSAECYNTTSLVSISEESLIEWVKEHLNKLGRKFVIIVNKIIAKFSKDKEQLEKNIKLYKENPKANVHLAVSPKTLKLTIATIVGITAAIGTIFMCVADKDGKRKIVEVYDKCKEQLDKVKSAIRKDKKAGGADVKSNEAVDAATKTEESNEKTAGFFKSGMDKFKVAMKSANLTIREKLSNIGKAITKAFNLIKESSLLRGIFGKADKETEAPGESKVCFAALISAKQLRDKKGSGDMASSLFANAFRRWAGPVKEWNSFVQQSGISPIHDCPEADTEDVLLTYTATLSPDKIPTNRLSMKSFLGKAENDGTLSSPRLYDHPQSVNLASFGFQEG